MSKIAVIGAMELEVETLKAHMSDIKITRKAGMDFFEGILNGKNVIVVKCGVGKVNAGICVQILNDCFSVTHIINTGVAGSLQPKINIGDIVISSDAVYHDVDATLFGYQKGEVPQLGVLSFPADSHLADQACASCRELNPEIQVFTGRVASGDQFIADRTVKNRIADEFQALCTEMEGAAIAHASYLNQIPFVIIRAVSDKADDSAQVDYPEFERKAAIRCAAMVEHMAGNL